MKALSFTPYWQIQHQSALRTRLSWSLMCQSGLKEFLLCQTRFMKSQSSHTSLRHHLWFQTTLHHWQIPLTPHLTPSSPSRTSQDSLLLASLQQVLPVRRRKSTQHLSHLHQWCAQFLPTQRLPRHHQGWCLLPQRQLLLLPGVLPIQSMCLLSVKHQSQWSPL